MNDTTTILPEQEAATADSPSTAKAAKSGSAASASPTIPKFALAAVNSQVGRVSEILASVADTIDELGNNSALPENAKGFAASASSRIRGLAERANEEEAAKLLQTLQRSAAEHPVATASIGAAIGTALGLALSKLSGPTPPKKPRA